MSRGFEDAMEELVRRAIREEIDRLLELLRESAEARPGPIAYLTAPEAGELARVTAETIRCWVRDGVLPGHYAGRKLLLKRSELEAYLARATASNKNEIENDAVRAQRLAKELNEQAKRSN